MDQNSLLFIGLAGILCTGGDISLAFWAKNSGWLVLLLGLGLNLAGIGSYALSLTLEQAGATTALFLGFNILALALAGFVFFNETPSLVRAFGLMLLVAAIVLIEL